MKTGNILNIWSTAASSPYFMLFLNEEKKLNQKQANKQTLFFSLRPESLI